MTLADAIAVPSPAEPALPPVRARTETLDYQFPPARPTTVPPADQCSDEELLDLAAGAAKHPDQLWALLGSGEHVAAICELLTERIEPSLRDANGHIANHQRMLACAQAEIAKLEDQLDGSDRAVMGQQREITQLRLRLAASEAAHKETLAECCALLRESIRKAGGR